jgi:hypothetical protein
MGEKGNLADVAGMASGVGGADAGGAIASVGGADAAAAGGTDITGAAAGAVGTVGMLGAVAAGKRAADKKTDSSDEGEEKSPSQ